MDVNDLIDREMIRDVLHRYCRGVDRRDEALLHSVYHPDARERHGSYEGPAAGFIDLLLGSASASGPPGQHLIGNILIELDGDSAWVESTFIGHFVIGEISDGSQRRTTVLGGRYVDRFVRFGGAWKIAEREVLLDWSEEHVEMPVPAVAATFLRGVHGREDRSYRRPHLGAEGGG